MEKNPDIFKKKCAYFFLFLLDKNPDFFILFFLIVFLDKNIKKKFYIVKMKKIIQTNIQKKSRKKSKKCPKNISDFMSQKSLVNFFKPVIIFLTQ